MLATVITANGHHVGNNYWVILGPIVIALALVIWLLLTRHASAKRVDPDKRTGETANRGPVKGGVIEGSPSQRTRRDAAVPEDYEHRGKK
ncbi:hypothetical protein DZF91_32125 [Actinomadura logoneensis]|uniref:Uncharacterized protein n=1 Tax=Actinomadura logoneensis TaxID=2293572 RepID=A0A372JDW7_9ACTN|nr:hypothetical protein [Actinomadura logoneensis]RFU37588.1 hypothetical protein DZF91_32125 [Actinomadura logoneensis]